MKSKSNDPLQILLRSAMHQMKNKVNVLHSKQVVAPKDVQTYVRQCDRPQWTPGRLLAVVHKSLSGKETYLGVFQEMRSDLFKARRLVPSNQTAHGSLPREVVTGDHWLHPPALLATADTLQEVRAIEERFAELMKQWG